MESQSASSPIPGEHDQSCFVLFQRFHIFPFTKIENKIHFLLRKKPSSGKFVEFKGKFNTLDDPAILFSCARKLYKKTAGLLTNENVKYFADDSLESELSKLNLADLKPVDITVQQPGRIDTPTYQEFMGRVANTDYQYQIPQTQTIIYFLEIPAINVSKFNDYCRGVGLNFEYLLSGYDNIINGGDERISPETIAFLSQPGLSDFCTKYFVKQKPVKYTKTLAMFCCNPKTTHNKYVGLYYTHFKKFGEKWRFYHIPEYEFPTEDELKEFHCVITPGSPCSSYKKELEWIEPYYQLLRNIRYNYPKTLILGICFGGQTMASAFGGSCEKMPNEFLRGSEVLSIQPSFWELPYVKSLNLTKKTLTIVESHGDHIPKLPEDAVLQASSRRTGVEIFTIGDRMLGTQDHPEYTMQWTAGVMYAKNKETRDFQEVSNEVKKNLFPDEIDHEDLMRIMFSFAKCYTPAITL